MYGPGYPQQSSMSPWAAGGLGAVGGGLLGYELGQMAGEHEQQAQEGDAGNPDQWHHLMQGVTILAWPTPWVRTMQVVSLTLVETLEVVISAESKCKRSRSASVSC